MESIIHEVGKAGRQPARSAREGAAVLGLALRAHEERRSMVQRMLPFTVGIVVLLFGGYLERFLREDPAGHYLGLYLLVLASTTCIATLLLYSGAPREILEKTQVLPTTPATRFLFVSAAGARSPVLLAIWLAGAFSIAIFTDGDGTGRFLSVALFTALVFFAFVTTSCLLLVSARWKTAHSPLAVVFLLGVPALLLISTVYDLHWESGLPVLTWTKAGIRAAEEGEIVPALRMLLYIAGASSIPIFAGRRFS